MGQGVTMFKQMWPFSAIRKAEESAEFWRGAFKEWYAIARRLSVYAPAPVCRKCGSTELFPDPGGYYCDSERWDGAPLLCCKCSDTEKATKIWAAELYRDHCGG